MITTSALTGFTPASAQTQEGWATAENHSSAQIKSTNSVGGYIENIIKSDNKTNAETAKYFKN